MLLLNVSLLFFISACGRQSEALPDAVSSVQIRRLNTDLAVGRPRVSFALLDGLESLSGVEQVQVQLVPLEGEDVAPVWTGTAVSYDDYVIPYWIAYPAVPAAGFWGFKTHIIKEDGAVLESQFTLDVASESDSVPIGNMAIPSRNRTLATEPDLQKLSSGKDPNPELYQMTVAQAIETGRPTIVAFVTPGLCQTKWCAPVLDSVEAVRAQVGEDANFIHIEVYEDFQGLTFVAEMADWGLDTEPWVYVLASDGTVVAKFGGPLSPRELSAALSPLLP